MHGVQRSHSASREEIDALKRLSEDTATALRLHRQRVHSSEAQALVERVLRSNPDEYSLWNYRREVLNELSDKQGSDRRREAPDERATENSGRGGEDGGEGGDGGGSEEERRWKAELQLSMLALQRHPKCYSAWQHRVWLLQRAVERSMPAAAQWTREDLQLSERILQLDARNFHAWAHRERVKRIAGTADPAATLQYTEAKINEDFGNYSAWHYRSASLAAESAAEVDGAAPKPRDGRSDADALLREELERLRQAFFTDPDSQSAWFYHRWLLGGGLYRDKGGELVKQFDVGADVLEAELQSCEELLSLEPDSKWALLTKARLLRAVGRCAESDEILKKLEHMDPMRRGYYEDLTSAGR